MPFKVGVTTGLYSITRAEELATAIKKLGFGLTRGTSVIENALDVPHEVTETEGVEIRHIIKKQEVELLLHGSLTIPMCIPERGDWRDAHDHMQKSIRSAVHSGATYINFHSCLNIWLELITYAGRKLTMAFCDHEGRFISHILAENEKLRNWFVEERWREYLNDILTHKEYEEAVSAIPQKVESWRKEETRMRLAKAGISKEAINAYLTLGVRPWELLTEEQRVVFRDIIEKVESESSSRAAVMREDGLKNAVREKLKKRGKWESEELRAVVGIIDGYHIMAHHIFFTKDTIWTEMVKMYPKTLEKYKLDYSDDKWLDNAWEKAEGENDRKFKEFFYGVVGAKYLEGHLKRILEWMEKDYIGKDLADNPELQAIARKLLICIEHPDARDPTHAGMHLLWNTRQIYAAIKTIRKTLRTDKVWMLCDFEHLATQGLDPIKDTEEVVKIAPDLGSLVMSVHANAPNPGHAHEPLELGDVRVYRLLWLLRKTGFGKLKNCYIIYERGGAKDPFARSIETLRLCVKYLEKSLDPGPNGENLPAEFFGFEGPVAGGYKRQEQIIREHAWEPLKDLLEMPEEEWTMLSQAAIKKGKKPEAFKKGELR